MMRALGRRYVYYVNKTYLRTGTLWEGRYKSCLIDSDHYLLSGMRYIELNPVRANMVSHPSEYEWSSYRINAQGEDSSLIEQHPLYVELGSTIEERIVAYRELFRDHMSAVALHEIRDALNHEWVLGRSYFKDKIEEMTKRQARLRQPGRPRVEEEVAVYLVGY